MHTRPRDLLYLCRAAIDQAVTARHAIVEEVDLIAAEGQYSLFAFEAVTVECQQRFAKSEVVLLEFAGAPTRLTTAQLDAVLSSACVSAADQDAVVDALRDVGFLGVITGSGPATFSDTPREKQKADVLARKHGSEKDDDARYAIHRAYWAYLELEHSWRTPNLGV